MEFQYLSNPLQIVLNITNQCNLNCLHCFNNSGSSHPQELDDGEFLKIIKMICQIKPFNICFSGGEPLLRKELLLRSSELLANHGIRISLVTNGVLLDQGTFRSLLNSGIKEIAISLDGINPKTHNLLRGSDGAYERAMKALEVIKESGFSHYEVTFTVTQFNAGEFEEYVRYFDSQGFPLMTVRPMVMAGRAKGNADTLMPSISQYRRIWRIIYATRESRNIEIEFGDPLNHIFLFSQGYPFFGMEVKSNGDLISSPYIPYKLGSLRRHSIQEYWEAGWAKVWQLPQLRQVVSLLGSRNDLLMVHDLATAVDIEHFDLVDTNERHYKSVKRRSGFKKHCRTSNMRVLRE